MRILMLLKRFLKLMLNKKLVFLFIMLEYFPFFVYPQVLHVPFFSQRNIQWSGDTLGSCVGCTIGTHGCATTSKAMVFNYFYPNYTNPGQLNTCLLNNNGYAYNSQNCPGYCLIPHDERNNNCAPPDVSFAGYNTDNLYSIIDSELLHGYPVIVKIHSESVNMHFVVLTGKIGSTYYINDPYDLNFECRTLNNGYFGNYEIDAIWLFRGNFKAPLSGDWDGNRIDTFGYYESNVFHLDNGQNISFGIPGDYPIIGDWDGDGKDDIGVFRPKEEGVDQSTFYLELLNDDELGGSADYTIPFGYWPNDIPIVGDWDGDGDDDIGGYYPANSTFYLYLLDLNTYTAISYLDVPFGQSCDYPIIGDWDCDGDDDLGVFRKKDPNENTNNFYFDINLTGDQAEYNVTDFGSNGYGNIGDIPIIGDWDGDGDDNIGVYRPSDADPPWSNFHTDSNIPYISDCGYPPNSPSNLTAGAVSFSQIDLSWDDNSSNEDGFIIERKLGIDGTYNEMTNVGTNITSYSDTGLNANTTYYYRLKAYNNYGYSDYSNETSATTPSCPTPGIPSDPFPSNGSTGVSIYTNLEWSDCSGATSYDVYFGASSPPQLVGIVTSSSYDLGSLNYNTTYYWRIVAKNECGETPGTLWSFSTQSANGTTLYYEDSSSLFTIDSNSLVETYLGSIGFANVTDIAFSPTGQLFGCTFGYLLSIDPVTVKGSVVGSIGFRCNALAFHQNGILYGATTYGEFITIDTSTGKGTYVSSYPGTLDSSGDLAFAPDGTLYATASYNIGISNDYLLKIDPSSGSATIIGNSGFNGVFGLAFDKNGNLYGFTEDRELLLIDTSTGYGMPIGNLNHDGWGATSKVFKILFPIFDGHDFNGDGASDVSVWRPSDGKWYLRGIGIYPWGTLGDIPANGNYDTDDATEIAVWRPSDGKWYIKDIGVFLWGTSGDIPVPNDYDGDDVTDIAIWRSSDGKWYIKDIGVYPWGTVGDIPVPGDYNGDNISDISVWRSSEGKWYIKNVGVFSWGTLGDIPVPGDFNGDGTTDIAVWRSSDGKWYIRGQGVYSWGTYGDIPVPGDFNGDGTTDIAVWRPSDGKWYIRNFGVYSWGTFGDIPLVR